MRPLIVIGNWKMNGSLASNEDWIKTVARGMERGMPAGRQFVVCPPFPYLAQCDALIKEHSLAFLSLGAQDASAYASGAYTGEVAASMLKEMGCSYVIVGHSERRQIHHEVDEIVASKALQILDNGMTPVICVGETADERNSGRATEVVCAQVAKQVNVLQDRLADCLIAYEPVWAIGTGKVASAQVAQDMHRAIRLQLAEFNQDVASHVGILYGGSVKPDNAVELFAMPDIDGGLVGGASSNPQDFLAICQAQFFIWRYAVELFKTLLIVLQVVSALAVIVLVLLQQGKGADMGAAFGSGSSGSLFGASGSANFLSHTTAIFAALFFISTLGITWIGNKKETSPGVLSGTVAPTAAPAAPAAPVQDPTKPAVPK